MENVTLGLAVLLAVGMLVAKAGQKINLPSVTGYILAGLLLGPSGASFITRDTIGHNLDHFTEIALMLIAFGIGEQIELKRLRKSAWVIGLIGVFEAGGAFFFVGVSSFLLARVFGINSELWVFNDYLVLALLLGSISVATAPATSLHVMRELKAQGPLTSTLMPVVAFNNGNAIIFFGLAMSISSHIIGSSKGSLPGAVAASLTEISFSLVIGMMTGLVISFILPWLKRHDEMLTAGLALLLFCGELSRLLDLSPLLAGMAAGFTVINRVTRDVRLFRALNSFEPPIYVLFFTLAGTHLDFFSIGAAGWMGLAYFFCRMLGKYCGAFCGALLAGTSTAVRKYLGMALVPQAGVAIGLIFLINSDARFDEFSAIITPVVLAGVILAEVFGPILTRHAMEKAGEAHSGVGEEESESMKNGNGFERDEIAAHANVSIVPWIWRKLVPHFYPEGVVIFGASHPSTICGLARISTILAHHFRASPLSVRVVKPEVKNVALHGAFVTLFSGEKDEVESIGYGLDTQLIQNENVASGIVAAVKNNNTKALVLGYPVHGTMHGFKEILQKVAMNVSCPLVVVKFYGELHTENILVPVVSIDNLTIIGPIVHALSKVGEHNIEILYLLPGDETEEAAQQEREKMIHWADTMKITSDMSFRVERTDARHETIFKESKKNDLVVMGTSRKNIMKKFLFGSLTETVVKRCRKPVLIVCLPVKGVPDKELSDWRIDDAK